MEDRCIACGAIIPEGRMICPKCEEGSEGVKLSEEQIAINRLVCGNTAHSCKAGYIKLAIKALKAQIKMKEWIEAYNQPEFKDITWNTEEVIGLLNEFLAE